MSTAEHVGARVRYWRRRRGGMTQETLAGLAGLSRPYISQIEAGNRSVDRRSTLVAIAAALQVSVADLLGQPGDPTDPARSAATTHVPAIRVALVEIEEGDREPPCRGVDEVAAAVDHATEVRRARSDYATVAAALPGLLQDAAGCGGVLQARVGFETAVALRNLGYRDLALSAARVAVAGALESEDPAWIGAARHIYALSRPVEAAASTARRSVQALAELQQAAADERIRQVLGMLHLSSALAAAVNYKADDAMAHLRAAEHEARTLGDPTDGVGFNLFAFGPLNVALWRMTVAAELGEHGRVLEIAGRVSPDPLRVADRRYTYWLTYGRALAHSGRTDPQARAAFLRAEQAAPVPFAVNPLAHDAILAMVNRTRRAAIPGDLRVLATRLGIDLLDGVRR